MAIFQLRMGKVFPIFLSIHPLFRFNFSLLISIRNIVSPDEIQKQGLQERVFTKKELRASPTIESKGGVSVYWFLHVISL
jgi:hypothetical protein